MHIIGKASKTAFFYKKFFKDLPNWRLIYKLKCKSTEVELNNYLKKNIKLITPVAIISKQQISGYGQNSRYWVSPSGGIWLSAAYPIYSNKFSPEIFSLSIACKLCETLSTEVDTLKLKWPNDILFGSKKLIGFLPRVVTRGNQILYARVGIGFNLNNKTPDEGISLSEITNKKRLSEYFWTSRILYVICEAIRLNHQREKVISLANNLIDKKYMPSGYRNNNNYIKDIDSNGNLRIINNKEITVVRI